MELLARLGEAGPQKGEKRFERVDVDSRLLMDVDAENCRADFRWRVEGPGRDPPHDSGRGTGGERSAQVGQRTGTGGNPLRDLLLHHHHRAGGAKRAEHELREDWGSDVVGQARDDDKWLREHLLEIQVQRIALNGPQARRVI